MLAGSNRRRWLLGGGAALLLAALYGLDRRMRELPIALRQLSVALPLVPHAGLLHLAAARNLYERCGLAVTLLPQIHGKASLAEMLKGKADLAVAADVPVVVEMLKGTRLSIVAAVANASNELAVLGSRERGIRQAGDLKGRRIGVTLGTSGEYFLWAFLVHERVAPQTVQLVDLPPAQLFEALRSGKVDAVAAWQPVRHEVELGLGQAVVSLHAPDAYAQNFVLVGQEDFVRTRQDELRHLLRALLDAEEGARADPAEALTALAARFGLRPETLEPSWRDVTLEVEQQQAQLVTLEDVSVWAMSRGYAPSQPTPNFLSRLSLDALLAVRPERVTVVR